jgi:hypothetical protein
MFKENSMNKKILTFNQGFAEWQKAPKNPDWVNVFSFYCKAVEVEKIKSLLDAREDVTGPILERRSNWDWEEYTVNKMRISFRISLYGDVEVVICG